jgi:hypothetical protein
MPDRPGLSCDIAKPENAMDKMPIAKANFFIFRASLYRFQIAVITLTFVPVENFHLLIELFHLSVIFYGLSTIPMPGSRIPRGAVDEQTDLRDMLPASPIYEMRRSWNEYRESVLGKNPP